MTHPPLEPLDLVGKLLALLLDLLRLDELELERRDLVLGARELRLEQLGLGCASGLVLRGAGSNRQHGIEGECAEGGGRTTAASRRGYGSGASARSL